VTLKNRSGDTIEINKGFLLMQDSNEDQADLEQQKYHFLAS